LKRIGFAMLALGLTAPSALRADTVNVAGDSFVNAGQPVPHPPARLRDFAEQVRREVGGPAGH
jgi:hypothetical protein